jgi:lysophospholipase L1-like esterase
MSKLKIVVIGDSLTSDEPANWATLVQARLPAVEVVTEAHGGWSTTSYFRERLAHEAFQRVPGDAGLCVVLLGSNNLFEAEGGSEAAIVDATEGVVRIVEHVQKLSPSARDVLLIAPPTVALKFVEPESLKLTRRIDRHSPHFLAKLSAAYRALAASKKWRFVDLFPLLSEDDYVDSAHPTAAGQLKLAHAITPEIEIWLNEQSCVTDTPLNSAPL